MTKELHPRNTRPPAAGANASAPHWKVFAAFITLVLIVVVGTFVYRWTQGWTLLDSLFMTVITLSTVGYSTPPMTAAGTVFTICLIVAGVGTVTYAFGMILRTMLSGELRSFFGRTKLQKEIESIRDHVIVCGFGRMGETVCRELVESLVSIVVVEQNDDKFADAVKAGYLTVHGDATDDEVLLQAGVERARALIAALQSDADNLFVTMSARGFNAKLHIVARATDEGLQYKFRRAGASRVVAPYLIGASRMTRAVLQPNVLDFIEIATGGSKQDIQLEELPVCESCPFIGKTLKELEFNRLFGAVVVGIRSATGDMIVKPSADATFEPGDIIIALGEKQKLKDLRRQMGA